MSTDAPPGFLLEPAAYVDPGWLERERDLLFSRTWTLVGDAATVSEPGGYLTAVVGRAELLVVRGDDGHLRAFHNLCRHRGMTLAEGCGRFDATVACSYHGWRFDLEGRLVVVPQRSREFPDLDLDRWPLLAASVEVWEGMVLVHPDPDAPPLAEAMAGVLQHLGSHRPGGLAQVAQVEIQAACNWKLFVENHVDVYHLWYLHERSLGDFDHARFEHHQQGGNWASYEPRRSSAEPRVDGGVAIRHLAPRDLDGIGAHLVFPNLLMATTAGFFATYAVYPLAADRSRIDLRVRAEPDADVAGLVAAIRGFVDEDVSACEGVQRAMASGRFAVGPLARHHEAPITAFHTHLLAALGGSG